MTAWTDELDRVGQAQELQLAAGHRPPRAKKISDFGSLPLRAALSLSGLGRAIGGQLQSWLVRITLSVALGNYRRDPGLLPSACRR